MAFDPTFVKKKNVKSLKSLQPKLCRRDTYFSCRINRTSLLWCRRQREREYLGMESNFWQL